MGEVYELDIAIYAANRDTKKRDKHFGYLCRDCRTVAWTENGGKARHAKKAGALPPDCHPRMNEILKQILKGMKAVNHHRLKSVAFD